MGNDGLLKVTGRLQRSKVTQDTMHPTILDPDDHLVKLLIDDCHAMNGHVGTQHTLHLLRKKYWIIRGLSAVKQRIGRCWTCKKARKPLMTQQMAPLPPQRLTPEQPPFTFTGLDFFGPLLTKLARKEFKRYGCVFTFLCSRAIHLEMAYDLSNVSINRSSLKQLIADQTSQHHNTPSQTFTKSLS